MKRKKNWMKNYKECFSYLGELKNYFFVVVLIFVLAFFLGFFYPSLLEQEIKKLIEEILKQAEGLNIAEMFIFIFSNNLTTAFFALILGILLGLFPLVSNFLNGYVLGYVMQKSAEIEGFGVFLKLVPHGIFELPALFISLVLGVKLGMFVFSGRKKLYLKENLQKALKIFIYVVVPLLLIAGIIETLLIFFIR